MRRPVPKKRHQGEPAPVTAATTVADLGTGPSAPEPLPAFDLAQLDPRALVLVMTDVVNHEFGFTTGDALRQNWESSKVQRVGHYFNADPIGCNRVHCPDGSSLFIRFNSLKFQLLDEAA